MPQCCMDSIIHRQSTLIAGGKNDFAPLLAPDAQYSGVILAIADCMRLHGWNSIDLRLFYLNESGLLEGVTATKLAANPREPGSVLATSGLSGNLQGYGFKIGKK